eukprot:21186-Eustigmatos_ZCMA.PRE.1
MSATQSPDLADDKLHRNVSIAKWSIGPIGRFNFFKEKLHSNSPHVVFRIAAKSQPQGRHVDNTHNG